MKIFQGLGLPRPRAVAALPRAATGPAAASGEAAAAAAGGAAAAAPGGGSEGGAGGKGAETWTKKWGNMGKLRDFTGFYETNGYKWCKMMETRGFHGKIWWNLMDTHGFSGEQWWNMMKSREIHRFFMIFHDNICTHHVGFIEQMMVFAKSDGW